MSDDVQFPSREQMLADIQQSQQINPMPVSEPSTASDMLSGAEKGLGGDIVAGGMQSGLDSLQSLAHNLGLVNASPTQVSAALKKMGIKGDIGPSSEKQMYRQGADEQNKQFAQAQARSPIAYGAGELGGMGLGISGGESALEAAGLPTKILGTAPKGAGIGERLLTGAVNAVPVGATIGAMQSKGNLVDATPEQQAQVGRDAIGGAETASLLSGGLHLAGEGIGALANKTGMGQDLTGAFKLGTEGKDLTSPESQVGSLENPESLQDSLSLHDTRAAQQVLGELNQADDYLGHEVGKVLDDGTQQGINVQANPQLTEQISDLLNNPEVVETGAGNAPEGELSADEQDQQKFTNNQFKDFFEKAKKFQTEGLDPIELQQFRNDLADFGRQIYNKDQYTASQVFKLSKNLTSVLRENVPGYTEAADRLNQFRQNLPEQILSKDNPQDVTQLRYSGTRNVDTKLLNNIKSMIRGMSDPANQKAQGSYSQLLQGIQNFSQQEMARKAMAEAAGKPFKSIFDQVGSQPQDIQNFFKTAAARSKLIQNNGTTPDINLAQPVQTLKKAGTYLANKAGLAYGKVSGAGQGNEVLDTGKKLYAASNDALKGLSQKISELPGQKSLSAALDKAIAENDYLKKDALLYHIMQNPNLRNLVNSNNLIVGP